jgi:hypothetical protein
MEHVGSFEVLARYDDHLMPGSLNIPQQIEVPVGFQVSDV